MSPGFTRWFYNPDTARVIAPVVERESALNHLVRLKLHQNEYGPRVSVWTEDAIEVHHDAWWSTTPVEITEERYWEMLEVLPPLYFSGSCFAMCEFTSGNVTAHFVRVGVTYWEFQAPLMQTRAERLWHLALHLAEAHAMEAQP